MIRQAIADALARIRAAIASHDELEAANADLRAKLDASATALADLQTTCAGHEATIADLTTQLNDATTEIADIEAAVLAVDPGATV